MRDHRKNEMDRSEEPRRHDSRRFPGHEARIDWHLSAIRRAPCECGSENTYGGCCIDHDRQRSWPGIRYSLPRHLVDGLRKRRAVENRFRLRAFSTFYRASHEMDDPVQRFVHALVASAASVDPEQILAWHQQFGTGSVEGSQ